ncbi:MAG: LacI family DNA-binding transcriptional regulator [Rhodospirillales bacterium]|nr:LacI family DNA-binding transcriptional regulator [Rhodospirillales bacterium]
MTKRITIRDVAKSAKVSVSTVSHVVNHTRHVEQETKKRVRAAISQLNYVPSGIAQALKSDRTNTIGMVVASSTNPFFAQVIHGVGDECSQLGFSLILANCGDELGLLTEHLRTLLTKRIDGLVVMTTNSSKEFFKHIAALDHMPVVAIDTVQNGNLCTVNDDSFYGGGLVGKMLGEQSPHNVACLAGPDGHPSSDIRLAGFMNGLERSGFSKDRAKAYHAQGLNVRDGFMAMEEIISSGEVPEAVFACNDLMAIGAICALHQAGLRVPNDVSIVGYDDIEIAAYLTPSLTTVRQQAENLGKMAADLLIHNLNGGVTPEHSITLKPQLIMRQSALPSD